MQAGTDAVRDKRTPILRAPYCMNQNVGQRLSHFLLRPFRACFSDWFSQGVALGYLVFALSARAFFSIASPELSSFRERFREPGCLRQSAECAPQDSPDCFVKSRNFFAMRHSRLASRNFSASVRNPSPRAESAPQGSPGQRPGKHGATTHPRPVRASQNQSHA